MSEKVLIVVDMINGFIKEGNMHDEKIMHIVPNQIKLLEKYAMEDSIFFCDEHGESSLEMKKFPVHCIFNTNESQVIDELMPYVKRRIPKNSTSAFFAPQFKEILDSSSWKEIIIMGCCTDICIMNLAIPLINYLDEMNRYIKIVVPKDCVETYDAQTHNAKEYNEMAFTLMKQSGIEVVDHYEGE